MYNLLDFQAAIDRLDLISPSIAKLLHHWQGSTSVNEILVAEIDPAFAGGNDFCKRYNVPTTEGVNCVIVESKRGNTSTFAACLAPVNYRIDFNGIVKKALNGRRVSLAPLDQVLKETSMEYGSVTPVGLPIGWQILIDERILSVPRIIVGAGLVHAKLSLPSKTLLELPAARIINNLAILS